MIPALTLGPPRLNRQVSFGHRLGERAMAAANSEPTVLIKPASPERLANAILRGTEKGAFKAFMTLPPNPNLVHWQSLGAHMAYLAEPQAQKLFRFMMQANLSLTDHQRSHYRGLVKAFEKHRGSLSHQQRECYQEYKTMTGRANPASNTEMRNLVRYMLSCPQDLANSYLEGTQHPTPLIIASFKGLHETDSAALMYILHQNLHHVAPHIP